MKNMKLLFFSQAVIFSSGCLSSEDVGLINEVFEENASTSPSIDPPATGPNCFNDRYVQDNIEIIRKLDLLFVIDTSSSLDDEHSAIANGIDSFINELPANVDYQIAVMLAHGPQSSRFAKLYKSNSGEPLVLKSSTSSVAQIRSDLVLKLTHPPSDNNTDGGEAGMLALAHAFDSTKLTAIQSAGFFRSDAALAVIFVSDENDICAQYPAGVTPVPDPNNLEIPAKNAYCGATASYPAITAQLVIDRLHNQVGDLPLVVAGIVYTNPATVVHAGENEVGYGWLDMINLDSGLAVDLATGNYTAGLAEIGTLTSHRLTLLYDFALTNDEVDDESIAVYVDGVRTSDWTYDSASKSVHVTNPGEELSVIDVNYCEYDEPPPPPIGV